MSDASLGATGAPAPIVRLFGWCMLGVLAAYVIENVFVVWLDMVGARTVLSGGGGWPMAALYLVGLLAGAAMSLGRPGAALRADAARITGFNAYIVRSLFWAVVLVGVVDTAISFLRAENLLIDFFSAETAQQFNFSRFVAPNFHAPLIVAGFVIGAFTRSIGVMWLALLIVAAELLIVISRFVFSYEQALMSDLVRYWYAALFLFASAYTLYEEGHVRVDVLYSTFTSRSKGRSNAIGAVLFGMTTCWTIIVIGFASKNSIVNGPVLSYEVSQTGVTGMYVKYQMAAFLGVFAIIMLIQFVAQFFESVADLRDEPGRRELEPVGH